MLLLVYAIIQKAELAKKNVYGYIMGKVKQFKLSVRSLNDFDRILNTPDEWTPPKTEPYFYGENLHQ